LYKNINPEEILIFSGFFFVGQGFSLAIERQKRNPKGLPYIFEDKLDFGSSPE
jgi:hypothetical protein